MEMWRFAPGSRSYSPWLITLFSNPRRAPSQVSAAPDLPLTAAFAASKTLTVNLPPETPDERIGRYKLLQKIGEGRLRARVHG